MGLRFGQLSGAGPRGSIRNAAPRAARIAKTMRELNKETAKILNDSITSAIDKADSLKEGFRNIRDSLDDIGRQFLKLALQKLVFDQLAGWLNNVFGVGAADGKAGGGPVEASRNVIGRDLGRNSKLRGLARG